MHHRSRSLPRFASLARRLAAAAGALLVAASLGACGAPPPDGAIGVRQDPIIGGDVDTGDPAVVLVIANQPKVGGWICTGTVITAHVVLTAAHCIDVEEAGAAPNFRIFTGDNYNDKSQRVAENYVAVKEAHSHPDFNILKYQQQTNTADVGVLITKDEITRGGVPIPPMAINRKALDKDFIGLPTRLVGYGLTGRNGAGETGTRRQTMTKVSDWDFITLYFNDPAHITCSGDSGGPAFLMVDGKEVLAGVTSGGDVGCNKYGFHSRVDAYAEQFIVPYMEGRTPVFPDMHRSVDASASGGGDNMGGCSAGGAGRRSGGGMLGGALALALALVALRRRRA